MGNKGMTRLAEIVTDVVCPFYYRDEGHKVICEGFCKAVTIQLSFKNTEQKKIHKHQYCMDFKGYPKCPLYPVINEQYEVSE